MKGPNVSNYENVSAPNINIDNSQSRIKVDLSHEDTDNMAMTGMEEEPDVIQPKPTLVNDPFRSGGSTPQAAPMHEMNQMNDPAQQAALIAEQQRAAAMQKELERQKELQRLQKQSKKNPTGNTNIRKLIKSAATRE